MPKTRCDLSKAEYEKIKQNRPIYICLNCGRGADKEEKLCKPILK
jgi:hypothetical protein